MLSTCVGVASLSLTTAERVQIIKLGFLDSGGRAGSDAQLGHCNLYARHRLVSSAKGCASQRLLDYRRRTLVALTNEPKLCRRKRSIVSPNARAM